MLLLLRLLQISISLDISSFAMPTHFIREEREIAKNRKIEILINYIRNYIRMCYYNIYRNVTSV